MDQKKIQRIAQEVIRTLKTRFDSFPSDPTLTRNAPFHKAFLRAFEPKLAALHTDSDALLSMSAWIQGLNTTLGQSFFESVAHILCDGGKKTFDGDEFKIYAEQERVISEHMTDLKNDDVLPDLPEEDELLQSAAHGALVKGSNFTADCFFEDEEKIVAIELKSVRPNSGETRGEKQKILKAKAELRLYYSRIPGCEKKKISYYFGFPFDPTADTDTGYDKPRFMNSMIEFSKFCSPEEIKLSDELWSFLSGEEHTMDTILTIIKDISTPSFSEDFKFLRTAHSIETDPAKYRSIAERWHLYSEIKIVDHWSAIASSASRDVVKHRNASPFTEDGKYNERRAEVLLDCLPC